MIREISIDKPFTCTAIRITPLEGNFPYFTGRIGFVATVFETPVDSSAVTQDAPKKELFAIESIWVPGMCLDVRDNNQVKIYDCNESENQVFEYTKVDGGNKIKNLATDLCLDKKAGGYQGRSLSLSSCTDAAVFNDLDSK